MGLTSLEMCAGAGGQALGLERAGFSHEGLIEIDKHACTTLRLNRPKWQVYEEDLEEFDGRPFKGIDLLAGGLPCPPFSVAGRSSLIAGLLRNKLPVCGERTAGGLGVDTIDFRAIVESLNEFRHQQLA